MLSKAATADSKVFSAAVVTEVTAESSSDVESSTAWVMNGEIANRQKRKTKEAFITDG